MFYFFLFVFVLCYFWIKNVRSRKQKCEKNEKRISEYFFGWTTLFGSIPEANIKTLEIPALERDFREGALYDARSERMVVGYSLWNADDLQKIKARRNDSTNYLMNASDTLSEKFKGLDMSASVQLSILSGLIKLEGGSASYLTKEINTDGKCSVQVKCFYKTGYKEMDMDQLTKIGYLDIARTGNNNTATHFVTKIQYGAGAIFTFTKQFESIVEELEVKAELRICCKTILNLLDGSFERNNRNPKSSSQIKCEFQSFGLSLSEELPTTYDEAVKFASNFGRMVHRSMVKQGDEALGVPCTVWLHPLVALPGCADAPKLYNDFTLDQAMKWIKFLEDCNKIEKQFGRTKKDLVIQLRSNSTEELREMIVKIRSGLTPMNCFNKKISSIASRLGSISRRK